MSIFDSPFKIGIMIPARHVLTLRKTKMLTIQVKNNTAKRHIITLFNAAFTYAQPNFGLPGNVSVACVYGQDKLAVSYQSLLCSILAAPMVVDISASTNNRQLMFYARGWHNAKKNSMEPDLTKEREPRRKKHNNFMTKWNPAKWNIADTHEIFMLDMTFECGLSLKPHQEFNLELQVYEKVQLTMQRLPEI